MLHCPWAGTRAPPHGFRRQSSELLRFGELENGRGGLVTARPSRPLAAARAPQAGGGFPSAVWRRGRRRLPGGHIRPSHPSHLGSHQLAVGGSLGECTAPGPAFCESNVSVSCNDRLVVPVAVQGQRRNSESPRKDYMGQCPCRRAPSSVHGLHGEPPQMRGKGRYRYRALGAVMGRSSKP